jgi:hypothetical protein
VLNAAGWHHHDADDPVGKRGLARHDVEDLG